jgi:hypothetical protein
MATNDLLIINLRIIIKPMKTNLILLSIIVIFLFLLSNRSYAQAPDWLWATSSNGDNCFTKVDGSGNIYAAGNFSESTITLGPNKMKNTGDMDIFLVKYGPKGNVLWAKSAEGKKVDAVNAIALDASGNIYLSGGFDSPDITFDSITLTNSGIHTSDIFIAKYDTQGNVLWAKNTGGTGINAAISIAVDALGNAYITGCFSSPTITFGSTILTNAGGKCFLGCKDIFIAKYNASGEVIWAKRAGGTSVDYANSIAVDASGNNIYVLGNYTNAEFTFDKTAFTDAGKNNIFLAKYDVNGSILWAKSAGGTAVNYANSIAVDASGNAYIAGGFTNPTAVFGSITLANSKKTLDRKSVV